MAKQYFKPGNMLYPLPAVMVSCQYPAGKEDALCTNPALAGKPNIITVAWAGTVCTNPPMLSISVRPERYSYHMIEESGEFVVNLTTEQLVRATDFCGVRSGKDIDKFKEMHLTPLPSKEISAPGIAESPVNIECKVREIKPLGSHTMFLADVVNVTVDDKFIDEKNTPTVPISCLAKNLAPSDTVLQKRKQRNGNNRRFFAFFLHIFAV